MAQTFEQAAEHARTAEPTRTSGVGRVAAFFVLLVALIYGLHFGITAGLRRVQTSYFGAWNRLMDGRINAQIVTTGSSRSASHYDPRVIQEITGKSAFNLGRNGSQTDMQVAVLKTYLKHNSKPEVVIHNLDTFSFQTTKEVYYPAQYLPFLDEPELYKPLEKINPEIWKSRFIPLYGYVVEDMNFVWANGLKGFVQRPVNDEMLGYDPRPTGWTNEFLSYKNSHPDGVMWDVEPSAIELFESMIAACKERGVQLIFSYSPEYSEMQKLSRNREAIFAKFREISERHGVPFWDWSTWEHSSDTAYFTNSQHLNAEGADLFSKQFAQRLKDYLASNSPAPASASLAH